MHAPASLDNLSLQWQQFLKTLDIVAVCDPADHISGMHSVYVLEITIDSSKSWLYVGRSGQKRIQSRLQQHKSEFLNCKTTTRVGKSSIYQPENFKDAKCVLLSLRVLVGGLDLDSAKRIESELCHSYREMFGSIVLTQTKKSVNLRQIQTTQQEAL